MKIIARLIISALGLLLVAELFAGIEVNSFYIALIVAIILGLLNIFVRPLLALLTLPINILTLGLFMFVINAALFWFASTFIDGFSVATFGLALVGSIVLSFVNMLGEKIVEKA